MNASTDPLIRQALAILREQLLSLTDDERLEIFESLMEGYCRSCGGAGLPCHCQNDE